MKSQIMMWSNRVLCVEDVSNSYRVLVENMKGRNHLEGTCSHKLEGNVKMALTEVWCETVDYVYVAQDRIHWQTLVNIAVNLCAPSS